jgi:four helix bundle protein
MFEKLEVYQKSLTLACRITNLTEKFPKGTFYLADQLNRAALSVPANIAEGNGRFHRADRNNFFFIARGSVHECIPLLELSRRKDLIEEAAFNDLKTELEIIAKMLSGLIQ